MTNPQMMTENHLPNEILAAFADGRLRGKERQAVIEHLSTCAEECRNDLQAIFEARELGVIEDEGKVVKGSFGRRAVLAAAAAAAAVVMILPVPRVQEWIRFQRTGGVSELVAASATLERRPTEARLSGGFPYNDPPLTLRGKEGDSDSYTMQAAAWDVVEDGNKHGKGLAYLHLEKRDAAVAALQEAVNSKPNNALLLSDLAAAYLERARFGGGDAYLPKAVEASQRAWSMKQTPEIAWNRALALEKSGDPSAKQAWQDYLKLDPSSPWADEVRSKYLHD